MKLPKANDAQFYIQRIDPMTTFKPIETVGQSNDYGYAKRRCKELAEVDAVQARFLMFFRVIEYRGEVVFLSHVNFEKVEHYDMTENLKEGGESERRLDSR